MEFISKRKFILIILILSITYIQYSFFCKTDIHVLQKERGFDRYVISNPPESELELLDFLVSNYFYLKKNGKSSAFYKENIDLNRLNWLLKYFGFYDLTDDDKIEFYDVGYIYLQNHSIGNFRLNLEEGIGKNPYFLVNLKVYPSLDKISINYNLRYYPEGFKNGKNHWVICSFEQSENIKIKFNIGKDIWSKFGFDNDSKKYPHLVFD